MSLSDADFFHLLVTVCMYRITTSTYTRHVFHRSISSMFMVWRKGSKRSSAAVIFSHVAADLAGLATEDQDYIPVKAITASKISSASKPQIVDDIPSKIKGASHLVASIVVNMNAPEGSQAREEPTDMSEDETEMPAIPVQHEEAWYKVQEFCARRSQVGGEPYHCKAPPLAANLFGYDQQSYLMVHFMMIHWISTLF